MIMSFLATEAVGGATITGGGGAFFATGGLADGFFDGTGALTIVFFGEGLG
jgi:hypothetical protein